MPITTKHTTVYVASDGSEHPTLEAAQKAEREAALFTEMTAGHTTTDACVIAEAIVNRWGVIKAIMEEPMDVHPVDTFVGEHEWGGANVAPRPQREQSSSRERNIPRRTGTEACRCRTLTPGQLCNACRANATRDAEYGV